MGVWCGVVGEDRRMEERERWEGWSMNGWRNRR